ncbi:MAG: WYL domain-containing protein [Ruminococcus sp.]|nr:WYL domain-containing protein [Ruminococcus sp.]
MILPIDYREKNPVMYAQTPLKRIEILCDRSLINNALDTLGFGIDISVTPKPDIVKITIRNSSYKGVKMWALEYCDKCEILAPQSLRDEMKKSAEHLVSVYSRNI